MQEKQETVLGYGEPQEVFTLPGELLEVRVGIGSRGSEFGTRDETG